MTKLFFLKIKIKVWNIYFTSLNFVCKFSLGICIHKPKISLRVVHALFIHGEKSNFLIGIVWKW